MKQLSVVVVTKDEEDNIRACLESIKWADEIIVVDVGSKDRTMEISKEYTDKVFTRENGLDKIGLAEITKNYGIDRATGDWIMVMDADEIMTDELKEEIGEILNKDNTEYDGYLVLRKNHFLDKWMKHGGWWEYAQNIELFRKGKGRFPELPHMALRVEGKVGYLKNAVIHNCGKNITEWLGKINLYTTLDVKEREFKSSKAHIFLFPIASFVRCFVLKQGFRDGFHGFIAAIFTAFYTFVKYVKLWEKKLGDET